MPGQADCARGIVPGGGGRWCAQSVPAKIKGSETRGGVILVAPKDLGLKVRVSGFLAGINAKGFTKEGKTWTSENYGKVSRRVEVEVNSAIGGGSVEWR